MNRKKLLELIEEGESSTLELKRKISSFQKIAKEISAFANTKGGYILFGVDDDKRLIGVDSEKAVIGDLNTICEFYLSPPLMPDISITGINGMDIVVVYIPESDYKPNYAVENPDINSSEKKVYIRVGDKSVLASKEMTRVLSGMSKESKQLTLSIGDKEKRLFVFLENNERATVNDFAKLVNISRRRAERLLVRLVRAGVLQIHYDSNNDYFTLV